MQNKVAGQRGSSRGIMRETRRGKDRCRISCVACACVRPHARDGHRLFRQIPTLSGIPLNERNDVTLCYAAIRTGIRIHSVPAARHALQSARRRQGVAVVGRAGATNTYPQDSTHLCEAKLRCDSCGRCLHGCLAKNIGLATVIHSGIHTAQESVTRITGGCTEQCMTQVGRLRAAAPPVPGASKTRC